MQLIAIGICAIAGSAIFLGAIEVAIRRRAHARESGPRPADIDQPSLEPEATATPVPPHMSVQKEAVALGPQAAQSQTGEDADSVPVSRRATNF